MSEQRKDDRRTGRAFLGRLARDKKANTIAIMTMALIPLAGLVGGGVDLARLYIVKTRLQHACDAGALAGRKTMGGGTWSYNSYAARTEAERFFDANIQSSPYGATGLTKTFSESAGKVSGSASATVPMTLMRIFLRTTETLTVTCDAEMRLPNTDVMFVLDTTGSMDDDDGTGTTKIAGLRVAVKCFYEIVARRDSDANCTTGTPSGGVGSSTQVRFGFVPYSQNVNVGRLLKPEWFADSWNYQTRAANYTTQTGTQWVQQGTPTSSTSAEKSLTNVPQNYCTDASAEANGYNTSNDAYSNNGNTKTNTSVVTDVTRWKSWNNGTCYYTQTTTTTTYTKQNTTTQVFNNWTYNSLAVNVSLLKNGSSWNTNFQWPIGSSAANKTVTWDGCIEERKTKNYSTYYPIPSDTYDLNIDSTPTSDANTKWGMALPALIYTRNGTTNSESSWTRSASTTATNYNAYINYACPLAAKKLQQWDDANAFDDYVDALNPTGNTYHDIGLIWGARLMSPTGIFASENATTSQGGEIERHMIFMTDGDACTDVRNYSAYGIDWFDKRTLPSGTEPTDGCTTTGNLTQQVNLRTEALCTAIKNKNITLWVIAFGNLAATTETRLTNCATSGRYFKATNSAQLQSTFKSIADQISQLRLTR